MDYILTNRNGNVTITFTDAAGEDTTVTPAHAHYREIRAHVDTCNGVIDEAVIAPLLRPVDRIAEALGKYTTAFTHVNGQLLFNGGAVTGLIASQILRVVQEDTTDAEAERNTQALVKFAEKLMENSSAASRDHIISWVQDRNLTITQHGDLLAYKGVAKRDDGLFESISSGPANLVKVNGQFVPAGRVPQKVGDIVEMDRGAINEDRSVGCSQGLHVGSYAYASDFGQGALLLCAVNPKDVVTVPSDCQFMKIRVSRYKVLQTTETETLSPVYNDTTADTDYIFTMDDATAAAMAGAEATDYAPA